VKLMSVRNTGHGASNSDAMASGLGRIEDFLRTARVLLEQAETTARDQRLVMDVGVELAASRDYEETLQKVARLVVVQFADWCIVDLVDAAGHVFDIAVAHVSPEKEQLARSLLTNLPQLPSAPHGVARVLRTLEPEIYSGEADEVPGLGHYLGTDHPDALRELGARSYICVPLLARNKAIGAITYVRGPRLPGYDERDLEVARELASRSAFAIENAMMHREKVEAVRARDELLAIASHDLRSLLNTVVTCIGTLRRTEAISGQHEALERLDRATARMLHLLDDILDVSRIERGAIALDVHIRDAERLGAFRVIFKPVDVDSVLAAVGEAAQKGPAPPRSRRRSTPSTS
jgi:signal transduction histidine kinase